MKKKGGRDWYQLSKEGPGRIPIRSSKVPPRSAGAGTSSGSPLVFVDDAPPSPEQALTRKRKATRTEGSPDAARKGKASATSPSEPVEPECSLPLGMWDPRFDLRHKIEFHFDVAEEKVMVAMSEQQMAKFLCDNMLRCAAAAYRMNYASDRGILREEVERLRKHLEDAKAVHVGCDEKAAEAAKMIEDGRLIMENLKRAGIEAEKERDRLASELEVAKKASVDLTSERDTLLKEKDGLQQSLEESREI